MLHAIQDHVKSIIPNKRTSPTSGWISFNAPCCIHRGESADKRQRGGVIFNTNGAIAYHCFNCAYTASYSPGRLLSLKFKNLLKWLGDDEVTIQSMALMALKVKDLVDPADVDHTPDFTIDFKEVSLPEYALPLDAWVNTEAEASIIKVLEYVAKRSIDIDRYKLHWSPLTDHNLHNRVIIPFYYQNKIVGWTARGISPIVLPKYYTNSQPDYVFNLDHQVPNRSVVVVVEGAFDAMAVDGVAILGAECSSRQADLIEGLGKDVILVPDFDVTTKSGKKIWAGKRLVDQAISRGWGVSFPVWSETHKDVSAAVAEYGKLFVFKTILDSVQTSSTKIELHKRKIMNQ